MKLHRGTIVVTDAKVLAQVGHPGDQWILRVHAPEIARRARAGSFAHLTCDPTLPMRRPLSIMRTSPKEGWVEFLYKVLGEGTRLLAQRKAGDVLSVMGPIGTPFRLDPIRPRPLLLGGGVGIPPMVFASDALRARIKPLVMMGSEVPFPFKVQPSSIIVPGLPADVIGCMPLLEGWGVPSRLASLQGYPGCFDGYITDAARAWLAALDDAARAEVEILACGPTPMLRAAAALAREFDLPCQMSLEEYMACAVGGCAGCTVEVRTESGPAMKRVCVDGPVFDSRAVVMFDA
ncbi:MAG: dihydroorotate dehydrogenase electron transfer subunit [Gammaproteobacteria bacterium]